MKNQIVFLCFLLLGLLIIACQPKQEAVVETETADATPKMTMMTRTQLKKMYSSDALKSK